MSVALHPYVRTALYCEINRYCQTVLLSRMYNGQIDKAPIWDDILLLGGDAFVGEIDIIFGGFPCQDISVAGHGVGLEGERSGLFYQVMRLVEEIKPPFVFLENVAAIRTRGSETVCKELAKRGYDCRWCVISAASVGAPHRRDRWFLLAYANGGRCDIGAHEILQSTRGLKEPPESCDFGGLRGSVPDDSNSGTSRGELRDVPKTDEHKGRPEVKSEKKSTKSDNATGDVFSIATDANGIGLEAFRDGTGRKKQTFPGIANTDMAPIGYWSQTEPPVCRVDDGGSYWVDRIRALGNGVVPQQAKKAFEILMGIQSFPTL